MIKIIVYNIFIFELLYYFNSIMTNDIAIIGVKITKISYFNAFMYLKWNHQTNIANKYGSISKYVWMLCIFLFFIFLSNSCGGLSTKNEMFKFHLMSVILVKRVYFAAVLDLSLSNKIFSNFHQQTFNKMIIYLFIIFCKLEEKLKSQYYYCIACYNNILCIIITWIL